jgi:hypothetical protein
MSGPISVQPYIFSSHLMYKAIIMRRYSDSKSNLVCSLQYSNFVGILYVDKKWVYKDMWYRVL